MLNNYIDDYLKIGIALSSEKDINKLLEMILTQARKVSKADAGTLYILNEKFLEFAIVQNDTLNVSIGGDGKKPSLPDVPLFVNNEPNHANVSSHVALTGEIVNIPDVYNAKGFDFTGPRKYDAATGYRSKSMIVIPMVDHENQTIGILQLLNSVSTDTDEVVAFSEGNVKVVASLASMAAVALVNNQLLNSLKNLLDAFIKSIATAIDKKSAYTGGHIRRVADLTVEIAREISKTKNGFFENQRFSEDEMEELRLAAWMHDVGKITTPEYIVDKSTKLETIFDRIEFVEQRFQTIEQILENDFLKSKIKLIESGDEKKIKQLEKKHISSVKTLKDNLVFLESCNNTGDFMSDDDVARVELIAKRTYTVDGKSYPYLTENEMINLSIRKGTLLPDERSIIENHVVMTSKILEQLPFPEKLTNVPIYAGDHHEKCDGSGYPRGVTCDELPLQSRIMVIADIFEALTAADRPYRAPLKLSRALQILEFMMKDNHIDENIYNFFINNELLMEYARRELNPEQIDVK
jgi:HD-GYP domain-containing protein (c-di-GMP phosphodiesterase class II)